jgi:hypothetical protein
MQSQRGEGPSLEALHGRDKTQGVAYKHMLYQSNDWYSGGSRHDQMWRPRLLQSVVYETLQTVISLDSITHFTNRMEIHRWATTGITREKKSTRSCA